MLLCPNENCGARITPGSDYCWHCGHKLPMLRRGIGIEKLETNATNENIINTINKIIDYLKWVK